jgi:RepB plasmid partitioning protein/ParB/Sulfiredoxin domain
MTETNTVKPIYPGAYPPPMPDEDRDLGFPTAPLNLTLGFDLETHQIPLDQLLPSKKVPDGVMTTRKFKQIVASIREIGLIEPLSVIRPLEGADGFLLLDGNLRVLALKELGQDTAPCLIAKDFETYTYNHRINRLSSVQEHYMLRRAIDKGVSRERLARAFNVNLSTINRRINLLHGICPKAVELLQDHQFTPDVTRLLRKMKSARQIEAVELMIAANSITAAHADALLKATPPEQRSDVTPPKPEEPKGDPLEQIVRLEKEMNQVQVKYKDAEENYGSELLNLVVAKGYLTKLVSNPAVKSYIGRHASEILEHFELVVNTISMEEALQRQAAEEAGTGVNAETRARNASASIAAYLAEHGEDEDNGAEPDAENGDADAGQPSNTADIETAEGDRDAQSEDIAPDQGSLPSQAAE